MKYPRENNRSEKASQTRCLNFALCVAEVYALGVMRCWRRLRATHYIVRPRLTNLGLGTA